MYLADTVHQFSLLTLMVTLSREHVSISLESPLMLSNLLFGPPVFTLSFTCRIQTNLGSETGVSLSVTPIVKVTHTMPLIRVSMMYHVQRWNQIMSQRGQKEKYANCHFRR